VLGRAVCAAFPVRDVWEERFVAMTEQEKRIDGELRWFNSDKDVGVIVTATGERLQVAGAAFRDGTRPAGRCAGQAVTFVNASGDGEASDVTFVTETAPRRARSRRSGHR
jgi:hypothetical protein